MKNGVAADPILNAPQRADVAVGFIHRMHPSFLDFFGLFDAVAIVCMRSSCRGQRHGWPAHLLPRLRVHDSALEVMSRHGDRTLLAPSMRWTTHSLTYSLTV